MSRTVPSPENVAQFVTRRMSLRHARVLIALYDTGNLSLAAESLHVTQPAVSKALSELEGGLGQTLFLRRGRNMQITPVGQRLLELARKMEAQLQRAAGDVAALVRGTRGELRIGTTNAALARLLPLAMTAMKREHPEVTLSVRTHALSSMFSELQEGQLDLVLARVTPQDEPLGLQRQPLSPQAEVLTISTLHPLARSPRLSWELLSQQGWIWHLPGTRTRTLMDQLWQRMALPLPTNLIETGDIMLALNMMRHMPLVTVMPGDVALQAAQQDIVAILPHQVELGLGELSIWQSMDTQSELSERFKDLLCEAARQA